MHISNLEVTNVQYDPDKGQFVAQVRARSSFGLHLVKVTLRANADLSKEDQNDIFLSEATRQIQMLPEFRAARTRPTF